MGGAIEAFRVNGPPNTGHSREFAAGLALRSTRSSFYSHTAADTARALCGGDLAPLQRELGDRADKLPHTISFAEDVFASMGDLWREDDVSELDICLAMSNLLRVFRRQRRQSLRAVRNARVFVANLPFEPHFAGAPLAAELLKDSGIETGYWTGQEQGDLIAAARAFGPAHLVLTSSPVTARAHRLRRIRDTVHALSEACTSPGARIHLGRLNLAPKTALTATGFTHHTPTALALPAMIAAQAV